jgi:hypothetical protein
LWDIAQRSACSGLAGQLRFFGKLRVRAAEASRYTAQDTSENVVNQKESLTTFSHPTPELPVADVERAQQHYRDALGFEIGWLYSGKEIGAVSRGKVVTEADGNRWWR